MTTGAGVTVAMIVKDEELVLERCLRSLHDWVDEIVVADTGSTDRTVDIAKSFGAEVRTFESRAAFFVDDEATCAEFGGPPPYSGNRVLCDFAAARNFSFSMATQPYVMWVDADDVVERPEGIRVAAENMRKKRVRFGEAAYHVGHTQQIWRTRLVERGSVGWVGSVHEDLTPVYGSERLDAFCLVQRRPERAPGAAVHHRNYKIMLRDHLRGARGERHLFYLAWASMEAGETDKAVEWFEQHLAIGTWGAQRAKALRALGDIYMERGRSVNGQVAEARRHYVRAHEAFAASCVEMPENPDGMLGCARASYFLERWEECARLIEAARKLGDPYSPPWSTSRERTLEPHLYYNKALWELRRLGEALDSCEAGLAVEPENQMLLQNKAFYETRVARWGRGA